jgi:hypothetical protein
VVDCTHYESIAKTYLHTRQDRAPARRGRLPPASGPARAARGEREGDALALPAQRRVLQARGEEAPRALIAHDPCAGGRICGEAGEAERAVAPAGAPAPRSIHRASPEDAYREWKNL